MNWDWEKLKKQQDEKDGGIVPPKMDDLVEKFKKFKLPGGPLLILLFALVFFGSAHALLREALARRYGAGAGETNRFGANQRTDRKSTRLNSSHANESRMPSSA